MEIIQDSTTFAVQYREERHLVPMANHKSSLKRIRANRAKYLRNRYQMKTTRTFIKRLRATTQKQKLLTCTKK